jgi:flagellar biogenesis protein FliO
MTAQAMAEPMAAKEEARFPWRAVGRRLIALGKSTLKIGRTPRRLRLCESLPLGERRFVAVVEFENMRFLLGGTANALVLLSRLEGRTEEAGISEENGAAKALEKIRRREIC